MKWSSFHTRYTEFPPLAERLLRDKALEIIQDLCDRTWVYSQWWTQLTTAGTYEYTISPSVAGDEVIGVFPDAVQVTTVDSPQPTAAAATSGSGTLVAGTTYYYQVTATVDDYGESLPCEAVSAVATATGTIGLTWDAIDGADDYYVYRDDGAGGGVYGRLEAAGTNSYSDDGSATRTAGTNPPTKSNLGREIGLTNLSNLKAQRSTWRHREGSTISRVLYDGLETVRIDPIPDTSGIGLQAKIALKPTNNEEDTTVPAVFERYLSTIDEGVRWRMHLIPTTKDHPWANPQLGACHRGQYLIKRSQIKTERMFGHGGPTNMRPRGGRSPWF